MPKMLSWAKKISGRSSPKKSGHEPEVDKDSSPAKSNDAAGKNIEDNNSSFNNATAEKSSTEKEHSSKERRRINSVFSRVTPSKVHSSDGQPSPPKQHSPSKTPSPEKTLTSVKKTPSFAKRFGSFRIPGLDRKSPEKSSRSKSRSPELETISNDSSPSKSVQHEPSNAEASEPVQLRDKNIHANKVHETNCGRVTEVVSKHEESISPLQNKPSETDRLSSTNGSDIPETHPQPEDNSQPVLPKLGRQSISEKLYGEVIKEFDKMRTTRSRVMSNEFGSVSEGNESLRSETPKEHSPENSNIKDSKANNIDSSQCHNTSSTGAGGAVPGSLRCRDDKGTELPCQRIDNEGKSLANEKESSVSRCELEKKELQPTYENHTAKEMGDENERGFRITLPSSPAGIPPPKPLRSPLSPSETPSSLHVDEERQSQSIKSSSLLTEDDKPQQTRSDIKNTAELTPKASPLSKFSSSIFTELSSSPVSNLSPASVKSSPSSGDKLSLRSNESVVLECELTKKNPASENAVETLAPSVSIPNEAEKILPSLPKSDPPTCVNDKNNIPLDIQVSETAKKEVVEDSPSTVLPQNSDVSGSSSPEIRKIENDNNPVPSVRISKLPKLSSETNNSSIVTSTTLPNNTSAVNHLPDLSEDCHSPSSNDMDGVKVSSLKEPVTNEDSLPVQIPLTNGQGVQELALNENIEKTDSADMSNLTESKDDKNGNKPVSLEGLEVSSKTENVDEDAEKSKQDSPSSSDKPSVVNSENSVYSHVHTDPEVSVVSCYNLDGSIDTSKSTSGRTDTCDSTDGSLSPSSVKDDSREISSKSNVVSPTTPQRSLHEKMNRSSEEVNSTHTFTLRPKENGVNKDISKTYTESGEYPSSGEGGSLPASPSVPRRRKKSHPVPVARSLQTLSPTSSGTLTPRETQNNRERANSQSKAPPRPPMPTSLYSPTHLSSSVRLSSTVSPTTSSNGSISSQETHKNSLEKPVPQVKKTEPFNPFDSDEDTETTDDKPSIATSSQNSAQKISLNPFDSDEDEDKLENNNNQSLNKKIQLPASYNPFDEDDDEDENEKNISLAVLDSTLKNLDDSIASLRSQSSVGTHDESTSKNPFDDDDDEEGDVSYNGTPLLRQSIGRQSLALRSSSPFQREGVRASLPSTGRGRPAKKKRQAPLPPGYRPSPATTTLPPRSTMMMMMHGESSTSLYDGGSLRKNSMTSGSSLSLSSPKRTPPPRPPPPKSPKGKSVSMAQL